MMGLEAKLFCGGSFFLCWSGCCCFCFGLGCGELGFFLGYGLGLCLVASLLGFKTRFCIEFFLVGHGGFELVYLSLLVGFPCFEATLSLGFVECAFLDATLEVFHHKHAFVGKD